MFKPTKEFHTARHTLYSTDENLDIDRVVSVAAAEVVDDTVMEASDERYPEVDGQAVGLTVFDGGSVACF